MLPGASFGGVPGGCPASGGYAAAARAALAGLAAAGLALAANRLALRWRSRRSVAAAAPLWEELLKTGLALWWDAPLAPAHAAFGVAEAAYELRPGKAAPARSGALAAALGAAGHLAFGMAAALAWPRWGVAGAVAAGWAVHLAYNLAVAWLTRRAR